MSNPKTYTNIAARGDNILYRGYEDGKRVSRKIPYQPTLFVSSTKPSKYKTIDGRDAEPIQPGSITECRQFIEQYSNIHGFSVYGNTDYVYQFIADEFKADVEYDSSDFCIVYLDIETTCENGFPSVEEANEHIVVITLRTTKSLCTFCLGQYVPKSEDHLVFEHTSEEKMLVDFLQYWQSLDPDIITGWNVNFFDMPYIINRMSKLLGRNEAKKLSPWGFIRERKVTVMNQEKIVYDLVGISTLDYFDLYRKLTFTTRESYKLDHIAYVELGERKASYDDYENLQDFYEKNFQRFVEYNIKDVDLVVKLEEKLGLLELALRVAYSAKVNHIDIFSQVKTWDQIIYHHLHKENVVIPMKSPVKKSDQFAGAYVKEPIVGKHDWVVSFDLDSLYPHLIMQYNLSPETLVQGKKMQNINPDNIIDGNSLAADELLKVKKSDLCVAGNGTLYTKSKRGFLPKLMETLYSERRIFKKKMLECKAKMKSLPKTATDDERDALQKEISKYHNIQLARKIQLNSAFGAIGNEFFRYYNLDIAEAITISGQLSIRWIEKYINDYVNQAIKTQDKNYVIAIDTDSIYLNLGPLVESVFPNGESEEKILSFLRQLSDSALQKFIDKKYAELADKMNAYEQKMNMKREAIANKGIWTAKKRYMLNVLLGEDGVVLKEPEQKIMGIETARSSTPEVVRHALAKCIKTILNGSEQSLQDFVESFRKEFQSRTVEEISFPRGVNGLDTYSDKATIYKKSTPIAVKGSLLYNHFISKNKLAKKYSLIRNGDKVKFVYLIEPNPLGANVVSFSGKFPRELDLERFIDHHKQFEVSFAEPLKSILNAIGWNLEKEQNLESLFA